MRNLNNAVFALATGLLALGLASSPASAQASKPAGWTPGQPFVVSISTSGGTPLMVVAAGRIPLKLDQRVRLFLPDLGDGKQELVYTLSIAGERPLMASMNKKSQEIVGRVHKVFIKAAAGASLGQQGGLQGGSMLTISADGMSQTPGFDLSGDIVREDDSSSGAIQVPGAGSLDSGDEGLLSAGGAGSKNVSTSVGGTKGF